MESFRMVKKVSEESWNILDGFDIFQMVCKVSRWSGKCQSVLESFVDGIVSFLIDWWSGKSPRLQIVFSKGKKFRHTSCSSCISCNATRGPPCTFSNPIYLGGGVGRLMVKFILNFHFDYWNISLGIGFCKHHIMTKCRLFLYVSKPNFICLLQDICRSAHGKPHFVRCNGTGRDKPACLTMAPDLLKQI